MSQTPEPDADTVAYSDYQHPDYEAETEAELCPVCRDLLAWHEQACEVASAPQATAEPEDATPASQPPAPASTFAFAIGHRVQPAHSSPAAITWRGQHSATPPPA